MIHRVLAPLDGSALAECVLPHLLTLSEAYEAEIILAQVVECSSETDNQPVDPLRWEMRKAEALAYLQDVAERLQDAGASQVSVVLSEGKAALRIVELLQSRDVDLVVLSSHGKAGLSNWNVNSVVRKVIQQAHRSTMIIRAYQTQETQSLSSVHYHRLLVPLDGSRRAECALNIATSLANFQDSKMILGHAVLKPHMPSQVPLSVEDSALIDRFIERSQEAGVTYLDQVCKRLSIEAEPRLRVTEDITDALHALVEEEAVDLVILSAHGYSGKNKWPFGSVTTSFIEYGTTPLLMIQDLEPGSVEQTQAERAAAESKGH